MKEKISEFINSTFSFVGRLINAILKFVGILILVAILIYAAIKIGGVVNDLLRPKAWTLFLYSTETPDLSYLLQRIDGYKTQTECLEKGFSMSRYKGSYECGYDCRYRNEYKVEICDRVCNQWGCRD